MFNYPNPKIVKTQFVEASAEETFKVAAQFERIAEFTPNFLATSTVEGSGEGATRVCEAPNGQGVFKEKITYFNEKELYYRYALVEGVPAKDMENFFRIVPLGKSKSLVVWGTSFEFIENPQMNQEQFEGFLNASVGEYLLGLTKAVESETLVA